MKKLIALTIGALAAMTFQMASAGPERYESKNVVQPVAPPVCDWTGFYIGIHGGWRGGEQEWQKTDDPTEDLSNRDRMDQGFGGLQLGYNRQFGQWFVLGFELSGSYGGGDDTNTPTDPTSSSDLDVNHFRTQHDWSGKFSARFGFTSLNNKLLTYGRVGGAVTNWNYDYVHDETLSNTIHQPEFDRWNESETRISPFVGVGVEYAFNCHWSALVEWNHTFLGTETVSGTLHEDPSPDFVDTNDPHHAYKIDLQQDSVHVGVNYKF